MKVARSQGPAAFRVGWPVGEYRGWSISRLPVPHDGQPRPSGDSGAPWLAERGEQWISADSYEWLLKSIDAEMAAGAA